jgi:hypothetical protein
MSAFKLNVRIAGNIFRAEGDEQSVRDEFRQFLEAVQATIPPKPPHEKSEDAQFEFDDPLNRVFRIVGNSVPALHMPPETENYVLDTILLLLLANEKVAAALFEPDPSDRGFLPQQPPNTVQAGRLIAGARRSGLPRERIDRTIAANRDIIKKHGVKRGTRYALTSLGKERAEKLLRELTE